MQYDSRYNFLLDAEQKTCYNFKPECRTGGAKTIKTQHLILAEFSDKRHGSEFDALEEERVSPDRTSRHEVFIQEVFKFLRDSITRPPARPAYTQCRQHIFLEFRRNY